MASYCRGGLLLLLVVPLVGGCATATRVGQPAPDIQGIDADGVSFKLSDYRGQVVLLDFWSST
jgi:hypothetical protein